MNINGDMATGYLTGYGIRKAENHLRTNNYSNEMGNKPVTDTKKPLILHGIAETVDGETRVGAWADAVSNTSVTVYQPADFDENNPVYHMKIWDADGNMTERTVSLSEVDLSNCDTFDMYAYSCYLSKSGKYSDAQIRFMMTNAQHKGNEGNYSYSKMLENTDWLAVIRDIMQMQYSVGNLKGYLDYKGFYEVLEK